VEEVPAPLDLQCNGIMISLEQSFRSLNKRQEINRVDQKVNILMFLKTLITIQLIHQEMELVDLKA
jgi:hypothetical protein